MWGSTLLLLLFATVIVGTQAQITAQIDRWGNISVATIDTHLYWVTKNNTHINVHSDDVSYQECDLVLNESHFGRIQVAGIERKILLLYRHNSTGLRILQIDPFLCFYVPLPSIKTPVISTMDPQLVIANHSLDVFLRGASDCLPCRLDVNGNKLEAPGQLEQGNNIMVRSFILKKFVQENQDLNYAFAANFKNGSSVLRRLDRYFNTVHEVYFKYHQIEALAVSWSPTGGAWIGIIYAGLGSPHERILAMYNGWYLWSQTRLAHGPSYKIVDTMLSINATGYSFVSSVEEKSSSLQLVRWWRNAVYNWYDGLVDTDYVYGSFERYDWQMIRRCDEGSCKASVCTVLNSYVHNNKPYSTRSTVSCY